MPITHEIALVMVLIVTVVSFFIGILLGKASPAWLKAGIAFATLAIVVRMMLLRNPEIEYRLFKDDWYSFIRPWWGYPLGTFLTGAAIPLVNRFSVRVLSKAAAVLVLFVSGRAVMAALAMDYSTLQGNYPNPDSGLVTQKTTYSCGAASSAMLLNLHGIRTSEGEMAEICMTNAAFATDEFNVRRGIRKKLAATGLLVKLEVIDFQTLKNHRKAPMMAVIKFEHLLDHWVVIKSISDRGNFEILDPIGEQKVYSSAEFEDIWKGKILYIY